MSRWCIDQSQTVHNAACKFAEGSTTPYVAKPKTNGEMLDNLARVDTAHGHKAPSALTACENCIPEESL